MIKSTTATTRAKADVSELDESQVLQIKKQQIKIEDLNSIISKSRIQSRAQKHEQAQQLLLKFSSPTASGSKGASKSGIGYGQSHGAKPFKMPYSGRLAVPIDHDNKTLILKSLSPINFHSPHLTHENAAVSQSRTHNHQNLTFNSVYSDKVKQRKRDPSQTYERHENVTQLQGQSSTIHHQARDSTQAANKTIGNGRLADKYFFHKDKMSKHKIKDIIDNLDSQENVKPPEEKWSPDQQNHKESTGVVIKKSDILMQSNVTNERNFFIETKHLTKVSKIPSKQRRPIQVFPSIVSSRGKKSSDTKSDTPMQILERYIDSEIYVPNILIDESVLQNLSSQKVENAKTQSPGDGGQSDGKLIASERHMNQAQRQREYDERIRKNIEDMEKRLGLKKPHFMDNVAQFLNSQQTSKNIELLKKSIKTRPRQHSKDQNLSLQDQSTNRLHGNNSHLSTQIDRISLQSSTQTSPFVKDKRRIRIQIFSDHEDLESDQHVKNQSSLPIVERKTRYTLSKDEAQQLQKVLPGGPTFSSLSPPSRNPLPGLANTQVKKTKHQHMPRISQSNDQCTIGNSSQNFVIQKQSSKSSLKRIFNLSPQPFAQNPSSLANTISLGNNSIATLNKLINPMEIAEIGQKHTKSSSYSHKQSVIRDMIKSNRTSPQRINIIESKFFPAPKTTTISKASQQQDKGSGENHYEDIKKMLIEIIDDETQEKGDRIKRVPPNFFEIVMKPGKFGQLAEADQSQMKRVLQLLQRWYNFKDPFTQQGHHRHSKDPIQVDQRGYLKKPPLLVNPLPLSSMHNLKKSVLYSKGTFNSEDEEILDLDTDSLNTSISSYDSSDEEELILHETDEKNLMTKINQKIKNQGPNAKMKFLSRCLNMILLHKGDPFVAKKHSQYLAAKRRLKKEELEKNFYQRMQDDIKQREVALQQQKANTDHFENSSASSQALPLRILQSTSHLGLNQLQQHQRVSIRGHLSPGKSQATGNREGRSGSTANVLNFHSSITANMMSRKGTSKRFNEVQEQLLQFHQHLSVTQRSINANNTKSVSPRQMTFAFEVQEEGETEEDQSVSNQE